MRVYQASDESWIFFDGETKHTELTKTEAYAMSDKLTKAQAVQEKVTELAGIDDLLDIINAREYGQGQANALTNEDVTTLNITASDAFNGINLLAQVRALLTNSTPTQGDYTGIVNKIRSDV